MKNTLKPRNKVAMSPLLRKGGAHGPSDQTIRRQTKQSTKLLLSEWEEDLAFERELKHQGSSSVSKTGR